jgi:uncharacterized damage-inducible protein DinB
VVEILVRLLRHLLWADERTAHALMSLPAPPAESTRLYAHILGAEATWLARIAGVPAEVTPWPALDVAGCVDLASRNRTAIITLIESLTAAEVSRSINYTNTQGIAFSNSVGDMLHHVVMHGMYHRGQVALGVREAGGTPLATDFILYAREVEVIPPRA